MITLKRQSLVNNEREIATYRLVYQSVFGEWNDVGNCPSEIYYAYDNGALVGLLSGYPMSSDLWYLQRAGYIHNEQGKHKNLNRTREVIRSLHLDWPMVMTLISNVDFTMLKMSLSLGFQIVGTRIDLNHHLWVEMLHGGNK